VRLTREEAIDLVSDALSDACDMDVTWAQYARAAVDALVKEDMLTFAPKPGSPCRVCGRDASVEYGGSCSRGGCPFGADL
jgi:hypothetical protein